MKTNGRLIRRKRVELGHGMNRFAALAGISGAALSRIENGQRDPRPETLKKITDALGCQINEVLAEDVDAEEQLPGHLGANVNRVTSHQR
ncbi:helix-turn-helix transcriptional regulator [Streptomyces sp. NPDC001792]|uniref:helix-turn-helix domain-containing protein n=1 Tax=Streptomyces sp. NPDC001792 TaxID=3154524 RepID=UPI00331BC3AF